MMTLLFVFTMFVSAQDGRGPFKSDLEVLSQQGSLVKVTVARGEPIRIFVVGRQEAEIDLSSSEWGVELDPSDLSLRVRRVGPKLSEIVRFRREKNYFVIENPVSALPVYTLEVTTEVKGKAEKFNFKIDNRPK